MYDFLIITLAAFAQLGFSSRHSASDLPLAKG